MRIGRGVCVGVVTAVLSVAAVPVAGQETRDFDRLLGAWQLAPVGSAREAALEDSIRTFVSDLMPPEAIDAYREYLLAPEGAAEEAAALQRAESAVPSSVRWVRARELLRTYFAFDSAFVEEFETAHGGAEGAGELLVPVGMNLDVETPLVDVDLTLESSKETATAGDHFGVMGTVTNRSEHPIWIMDRYATLLPPPEIWGESEATAVEGFFPSLSQVPTEHVVRIDAQKSYPVMWHVDPRGLASGEGVVRSVLDFLEFTPGTYRFAGVVHVWSEFPLAPGRTLGPSASQVVTGHADIEVDLPIAILLVGGALGGIVGFLVRALLQAQRKTAPEGGWRKFVMREAAMAVLVAMMGTVLVSRLASLSGFVSLSINDVWGAAATGVLLQWFGVGVLMDRVRKDSADEETRGPTGGEVVAA